LKKVLVTGANGFVGKILCRAFSERGYFVRGAFRSAERFPLKPGRMECIAVGETGPSTVWTEALRGIHTVVHLASRVHVMKDLSCSPLDEYRRVNTEGTERLALMAASAGVRRLVYVSTVKVNGECTHEQPFREDDTPKPLDPYAVSKSEAEAALRRIAPEKGLEVTIVRPPLVYGPGVKANFLRLMQWVKKGLPLPLSLVDNRRSMVYVGNLADALIACSEKPEAAGETFMISDGRYLSTADLIRMIAAAMDRSPKIFPFPMIFLKAFGRLAGKAGELERLTGSLCVDSGKIRKVLSWTPPYTIEEGIGETVQWYMKRGR
jgi:nucleoside-diphosphate-sugar epimerase